GMPVPVELVRRFPDVSRAHFYNAVRTAQDAEHVRSLDAMAEELDRVHGTSVLKDYVRRVAALDFRRRAPLARAYAELLAGRSSPLLTDALTVPAGPEVADIVVGAMNQLDAIPDHLEAFRALVEQSHDPWFEVVLARAEAVADARQRDWIAAER